MIIFDMKISLEIISASFNIDSQIKDGNIITENKLCLVLRPDLYTKISLESGISLQAKKINLDFSTDWKKNELIEEMGYLCCIEEDDNYGVDVFGSARWIWDNGSIPDFLLNNQLKSYVQLTFSNVPLVVEYAPDFIWKFGKEGVINISGISFSTVADFEPNQENGRD